MGVPECGGLKPTHFVTLKPRSLCSFQFVQQIFTECFLSRPLEGVVLKILNKQDGTDHKHSEWGTDRWEWTLPINNQHILISTGEASALELGRQGAQHSSGLDRRSQWGSPDEMLLSWVLQDKRKQGRRQTFQAQVGCRVGTTQTKSQSKRDPGVSGTFQ